MIKDFDAAREAGLSVRSAVRWAKYVRLHNGKPPITVEQAAEQKRTAKAE